MDDISHGSTAADRSAGDPVDASLDEIPTHSPATLLSLRQAMRRARFDDAERSGVIADLRAARIGRLEVLQEALQPLLAQIPADVDCFDVGIMPGSNPRLFIDMIGFVEMARDSRTYRFLQDTRHGRVKLAESEALERIVEAATHYVARRLLERDKALAADIGGQANVPRRVTPTAVEWDAPESKEAPAVVRRGSFLQTLGVVFAFLIDVLGAMAFFALLAFAGWLVWANLKH